MKRSAKASTALLLSLLWFSGVDAQEVITPLFGKMPPPGQDQKKNRKIQSINTILLELPFMDDFSQSSGIPDTSLWSDDHVFINNNYGVDPVTYGVATLDALDSDGSIYPDAVTDPATFVADHLTSRPINLDYPVSDSIYFSFLYQPAGLGEIPNLNDSLLVDFLNPASGLWTNVWGIPGDSARPFRHVMIPVTEEDYLTSGFRFRFRNRVSLPGNDDFPGKRSNVDHWNVDYVRLGRNRYASDTILRDVAFIAQPTSMLKNLTSLPWAHFNKAYKTVFKSPVSVRYRNNDSITRNVTRSMLVKDLIYNELDSIGLKTAQDIPAAEDTVVDFDFFYPFDSERGNSAKIRFISSLRTDEFDPKINDTVFYDQVFNDYYSYDDGSAEAGYGIRGTQNGMVAVRYNSYLPDRLGGVDIYFNQILDSVNLKYYFKLMVWDDDEGFPGSLIYEDEADMLPEYTSSLNGFRRYYFSSPVPVDGPFHVGFRQYREYLINVGLDKNNQPVSIVRHYNLGSGWLRSTLPGVILFRPFLYDESTGEESPSRTDLLHIYPNPASDNIFIKSPERATDSEIFLEIFDIAGRLVESSFTLTGSYDISSISNGIYFVRARIGKNYYSSKLLINR